MLRKMLVAVGILVIAGTALLTGCGDSGTASKPLSEQVVGTWFGMDTLFRQGTAGADSFNITLTVTNTGYSMLRTSVVHGSSLGNPDSISESGTWGITGDSITFSPTAGQCFLYDIDNNTMVPMICQSARKLKIVIVNNVWTIELPWWKDPDTKFQYPMTK
jgi:hypothetical protein